MKNSELGHTLLCFPLIAANMRGVVSISNSVHVCVDRPFWQQLRRFGENCSFYLNLGVSIWKTNSNGRFYSRSEFNVFVSQQTCVPRKWSEEVETQFGCARPEGHRAITLWIDGKEW